MVSDFDHYNDFRSYFLGSKLLWKVYQNRLRIAATGEVTVRQTDAGYFIISPRYDTAAGQIQIILVTKLASVVDLFGQGMRFRPIIYSSHKFYFCHAIARFVHSILSTRMRGPLIVTSIAAVHVPRLLDVE